MSSSGRAAGARRILVANSAERQRLIDQHPEAALVTARLPLRANLSVLENIALVPRFRRGASAAEATRYAAELLAAVDRGAIAPLRDPDLSHEDRFIAKLLRAVALAPPIILIDRPGRMLPDTYYPPLVDALLAALAGRYQQCWIVDYAWNAPLYPPDSNPASSASG